MCAHGFSVPTPFSHRLSWTESSCPEQCSIAALHQRGLGKMLMQPCALSRVRPMQLQPRQAVLLRQRRMCCRCRAEGARASDSLHQQDTSISKDQLAKQAIAMYAAGATLGPFCDSLHSQGDVLHYTQPSITSLGPIPLETCW